jgi:hypothetical protein
LVFFLLLFIYFAIVFVFMLLSLALLIFTGIAGSGVWIITLFHIGDTAICLNHFLFAFTIVFSIITIGQSVHKVLALPTRTMPLAPTVYQLFPFTILVVSAALWGGTEYRLLESDPHVVLMALSLVFGYITSRLIVNRVCKEPSQLFHGILVPVIIVALLGLIGSVRDAHRGALILAIILLILAGIQFFFFAVSIILQLTSHLSIHAFTIVPVDPNRRLPPPPPQQGTAVPLLEQEGEHHDDLTEIHVEEGAHSIE